MEYEYYLKSIDRRWKKELAKSSSEKVLVLFPYLTPKTASLVLKNTEGNCCEVYTRFDLENFASGSSSLKILKELLKSGFSLYDLPKLHAKMIIIGDDFASIGSQNLTLQGTKNKEATVVISEPKEVAKIKQQVSSWISERQEITKEMIEDAEQLLEPLKRDFKKFKNEAKGLNTKITDNQKERERQEREERERQERERQERERQERERQEREERERQEREERERQEREERERQEREERERQEREERERQEREERERQEREERERQKREQQEREQQEREQQERERKFKKAVSQIRLSIEVVNGEVGKVKSKKDNKFYYSFLLDENYSLINWLQPDSSILKIEKYHRYLCINEYNGKIGWARVAEQRITFVGSSVSRIEKILLGNNEVFLEFNGIWDSNAIRTNNLQITISQNEKNKDRRKTDRKVKKLTIDCWFSINNLEWDNNNISYQNIESVDSERIKSWIVDNQEKFNNLVLKRISSPFDYKRKLYGKNKIIDFFGPEGTEYQIFLGKIDAHYVLLAK